MSTVVDIKDFRQALGQFPTGVTVITTLDQDGNPIGVTASSFNSVSMNPPLILWNVGKQAYSAKIFEAAQYFNVNVLGEDQMDISNTCARQGEDKFANINYKSGIDGCPILEDTAACFECKTWQLYDGGDHIIVVGEVIKYQNNATVSPLVFSQGNYAITTAHPHK